MKTLHHLLHTLGRFAVGFGIGLALVCASVIVTTDIGLGPPKQRVDAIRLEPVVVTISAERFSAIRADLAGVPVLVRTPMAGAGEV